MRLSLCSVTASCGTAGIKMKSNAEYVVPLHGHTVIAAENLSKPQLHKQHISGVDLMDKLKESLWKGMNLSQQHGAVSVDLLPYNDSLLLSTVQGSACARPKEPQEMVVSCCWAVEIRMLTSAQKMRRGFPVSCSEGWSD